MPDWAQHVRLRLSPLRLSPTREHEIVEELSQHLEDRWRELIGGGASEDEATELALAEFRDGNLLARYMAPLRQARTPPPMTPDAPSRHVLTDLWRDLRYAVRTLSKQPGFTAAAVLTLTLGIGANAGIFSVIEAALLQRLPYANPDRLVVLFEQDVLAEGGGPNVVSFANFLDWETQTQSFEAMAAARGNSFNLASRVMPPERVDGAICSSGLFRTLGIRPLLGRTFTAQEDLPGAPAVAVISYRLWQELFASAANVLSQQIRLDAENHQIVGVMPPGFGYPHRDIAVWVSAQRVLGIDRVSDRESHQFYVVARLRPGVSREHAAAELSAIAARIRLQNPGKATGRSATIVSLSDVSTPRNRSSLLVLFGATGCLLLVACINVASLLFVRGSQRRRELGLRLALGAGRGRTIRQLLTESTLLSLLGAAAGLVVAYALTTYLAAHAPILYGPSDISTSGEIRLDVRVCLFAAVMAIFAGIVSGVIPAVRVTQTDLTDSLKEGGRSATGGASSHRFRNALVMSEVALSLVLLVVTGLFLRSLDELRRVPAGVQSEKVMTVGLSLPEARYTTPEQVSAFGQQLLERLAAQPGVRSAGLVSCLPVAGYCGDRIFQIEGRPLPPGEFNLALNRAASPDYFVTAGIPLLRGRAFNAQDGRGFDSRHQQDSAVIISESMAKKFWPGADALGARIYFGDGASRRYEVIGIVGDVLIGLDADPIPTMYLPFLEGLRTNFFAVLKTDPDPAALVSAVRQEIGRLDADIPAFNIRAMTDVLGQSAAQRRFVTTMVGLFAALTLVLAVVGLCGVLSYTVAQRTGEIGIRMALGAARSQVHWLVLVEGMRPALLGAALGIMAAVGAAQLLRSLLFSVRPLDPTTFVSVPLMLLLVALVACHVPAWRAMRADPASALRRE